MYSSANRSSPSQRDCRLAELQWVSVNWRTSGVPSEPKVLNQRHLDEMWEVCFHVSSGSVVVRLPDPTGVFLPFYPEPVASYWRVTQQLTETRTFQLRWRNNVLLDRVRPNNAGETPAGQSPHGPELRQNLKSYRVSFMTNWAVIRAVGDDVISFSRQVTSRGVSQGLLFQQLLFTNTEQWNLLTAKVCWNLLLTAENS